VSKILNELKNKNIKLAVVSNNPLKDIKLILNRAGIAEQFDLIIGNDMTALAKNQRLILFPRHKKIGLNPKTMRDYRRCRNRYFSR